MAPALAPVALQGTGALSTLCTAWYTVLRIWIPLTWEFGTCSISNRRAVSRGLAQASLTTVGVWADRSVLVCPSSPMTPVPWATGGTGKATTLLCPSQSSHQPCYLVSQLFWARGHLCSGSWPHLDFGFLCFAFGSPCSNHQLWSRWSEDYYINI